MKFFMELLSSLSFSEWMLMKLLEALQALMDDEAPIDEKHWNDCCDKARAAIAKATGEQS